MAKSGKSCAEFLLKHSGTAFLHKKDPEYGNPVEFEQILAYDAAGVFLYLNEFANGVFYPWSSIRKLHLPRPMPTDLI